MPTPPDPSTRAARFLRRLGEIGADAGALASGDLGWQVANWAEEAPDGPILVGPGGDAWRPLLLAALGRLRRDVVDLSDDIDLERGTIAAAGCAIVFPRAGVAATGSLLEVSGHRWQRLSSLLPPQCIALLHEDDLVEDVDDLAPALAQAAEAGAAAWLLTGPSRTGDIELIHTIGVHGPGRVAVGLVRTPAPGDPR